jgi:hypothetical protein
MQNRFMNVFIYHLVCRHLLWGVEIIFRAWPANAVGRSFKVMLLKTGEHFATPGTYFFHYHIVILFLCVFTHKLLIYPFLYMQLQCKSCSQIEQLLESTNYERKLRQEL